MLYPLSVTGTPNWCCPQISTSLTLMAKIGRQRLTKPDLAIHSGCFSPEFRFLSGKALAVRWLQMAVRANLQFADPVLSQSLQGLPAFKPDGP
jgi:hypothetical protein